MSEDVRILAIAAAVWAVLASAYALVPAFHMPGAAPLWGTGALLFLGLAVAAARAEKRPLG
jgi:hypothetical protein